MKMLIVDDEIEICNIFCDFFKPKGYDVIKATSGNEAMEKVKTQKPDLVFLDIRMSPMDGLEVLRRIKQIDESIIVIMETVLQEEGMAKEAIKLGAYEYVTKPLSFDYLEKLVILAELDMKQKKIV